jgi:recombination protein RecR
MTISNLPPVLQEVIDQFNRLPGVGRKTATRLAFYLMQHSKEEAEQLANSILQLKEKIKSCKICFNLADKDICSICSDPSRNHRRICVVEDASNILLIEKTNEFKGIYHVLGGVISPLDGIGPENLRISELMKRLDSLDEVIIALNPSTEGEATSIYLSRIIKPMGIKLSRLARGIPMGTTLEFIDELTLGRALKSREEI